jgi:hypothetical protein
MRSITKGQTSALVSASGPGFATLHFDARPSAPTVKTTVTEVPAALGGHPGAEENRAQR